MGWVIFFIILIVGIYIGVKIYGAKRDNEIIECASCGNRMTRGNFKRKGGCPRCGSDLIRRTGEQAGRD
jgi:predicted RNA-binding Zn-ribbon protein involved in translation (DUF1610 family)